MVDIFSISIMSFVLEATTNSTARHVSATTRQCIARRAKSVYHLRVVAMASTTVRTFLTRRTAHATVLSL